MAFTLTPEREEAANQLIKRYPVPRAACIPILHLCQQQEGYISGDAIAFVADKLEMTTAQVQGVVTFYTSFHQQKVAPNVVWVCRTLSCELRGAKMMQDHLEKRLGCTPGHTSKDGKFTLAEGRVPRGLRPGADGSDQRRVLREPHARRSSTKSSPNTLKRRPQQPRDAAHAED